MLSPKQRLPGGRYGLVWVGFSSAGRITAVSSDRTIAAIGSHATLEVTVDRVLRGSSADLTDVLDAVKLGAIDLIVIGVILLNGAGAAAH